ncbi:E3 ubiquitin-protein ligase APD2-like isoform X3 [Magnolia sinica]|uniref:E3 ubiquitin-protein ligase APD2-like isoform X3 n=1 Tax=Magnolia sinica TaxID=86752 RepID=UPI002657D069|nr:E3 ubiquitin-protein ligase APD2-like isoform X3 [Magnolia sinica]
MQKQERKRIKKVLYLPFQSYLPIEEDRLVHLLAFFFSHLFSNPSLHGLFFLLPYMEQLSSHSSSPSSSSSSSHAEPEQQQQHQSISYRVNISISDAATTERRDEAWSCLVVLVTFWFFAASMTLILGFYGSVNLQLGPNCSRLLQANSLFVQDIKVKATTQPQTGPMLYGFSKAPPLDNQTTWSETHGVTIPVNFHKEWIYYLNEGSQINVSYSVKSKSSSLSLIISQGKEGLIEWIEDPTYPNTTLSWNIIHGNGLIQQKISKSSEYYVAVGNLNTQVMEVQLNFSISALLYNTTGAYYKCSPDHNLCGLKLLIFGVNAAVLTTPGPEQGRESDDWYVKLSYGPRWITYFVGSGGMTIAILLAFKIFSKFQNTLGNGTGFQAGEMAHERTPLLMPKDDDASSWGSSYDSVSHEEEDPDDWPAAASLEAKVVKEGEKTNHRRLCAICFDAPRDCFFLPCGHCATCSTCGTRIAEEAGTCPICRRKMKKVRKIFTV